MIVSETELSEARLAAERHKLAGILATKNLDECLRFPRYVQIETVRVCNARCPFCAVDRWDQSQPHMSDELFEKIVEQLEPHKEWIRWVNMQKAGEVTLDTQAAERISRLKQAGIRHVIIATNGALFDRATARNYLEAGLDEVMFSIDSIDPEEYRRTRIGLDYHTVVNNIRDFLRLRNESWPHVRVRIRGLFFGDFQSPDARSALVRYRNFWQPLLRKNDRVHFQRPHDWGGQHRWGGRLGNFGNVYHPCVMPWSTLSITAMGRVALCPQDFNARLNLGDANTQPLEEIWRSTALNRIRKLHAQGQRNLIPFCRGCVLYDREAAPETILSKEEKH